MVTYHCITGLETEGIFRYTAEFKKVRKKLQDFAKGGKTIFKIFNFITLPILNKKMHSN